MKYLIVQLCDTSVSFCHYHSAAKSPKLIKLHDLKNGLLWGVKNGLGIQILYPDYSLPSEFLEVIRGVEHIDIIPETIEKGDIIVLKDWNSLRSIDSYYPCPVILPTTIRDFLYNYHLVSEKLSFFARINVTFTDIDNFNDNLISEYENILRILSETIIGLYASANYVQLNLLTDRLMLTEMNNCNAGIDNITLSPDGRFYICPAFYFENHTDIGSPTDGLNIPNQQLYKIQYAPICRKCDAFHCRRCIWLNQKTTYEVNTPSHEQCVMAHIERKIAGELLNRIRQLGEYAPEVKIPVIDYLDPFESIVKQY